MWGTRGTRRGIGDRALLKMADLDKTLVCKKITKFIRHNIAKKLGVTIGRSGCLADKRRSCNAQYHFIAGHGLDGGGWKVFGRLASCRIYVTQDLFHILITSCIYNEIIRYHSKLKDCLNEIEISLSRGMELKKVGAYRY